MLNWLRSEFRGRFSLTRLLIATVFLGGFVGMNMHKIGPTRLTSGIYNYYGWPLPFIAMNDQREYHPPFEAPENCDELLKAHNAFMEDYNSYRIPLHHQAYCLLRGDSLRNLDTERGRILCAVINILFALVVFVLILLLQPPRRKVAAKVE